ncbi:MAG: transketolase [Peptococcaceae bacterium BICA1-7]|nr:MAG: transketolase [Peptococcaceae bacterium BICA1-7]HBV96262.1 transketolase [Desulfotomaculum sp.]
MESREKELAVLKATANEIRQDIIRMLGAAGSGHPGGSLSAADIVTALYFKFMRIDPENVKKQDRDRFILSKGHAAPVLYAALAQRGFFPREELLTLRKVGSRLQGHPDMKKVPGVDMSTGSLGQGLSAANGMALAGRLDGRDYRVYVLLGDGETQEGQVWEAAMASAHYRLDNLTAFLDHNRLQIDGPIEEVMSPEPLAEKWMAFGWDVQVIDGHDMAQILEAVEKAKKVKGKPQMIVAETVKGKGVSFMENQAGWHGSAPKPEEVEKALAELLADKL